MKYIDIINPGAIWIMAVVIALIYVITLYRDDHDPEDEDYTE